MNPVITMNPFHGNVLTERQLPATFENGRLWKYAI